MPTTTGVRECLNAEEVLASLNNADRIASLRRCMLDPQLLGSLQSLVDLTAKLLGADFCALNFVDATHHHLIVKTDARAQGTPVCAGPCELVVTTGCALSIDDTLADARFSNNTLVRNSGLRFYAGAPLTMNDGQTIGTLAIASFTQPRTLTASELDTLIAFASQAVAQLELGRVQSSLSIVEQRYRMLADLLPQLAWSARSDASGFMRFDYCNGHFLRFSGLKLEELSGDGWLRMVHPEDRVRVAAEATESITKALPMKTEFRLVSAEGEARWHLVTAQCFRQGESLLWVGTALDISERKDMESSLLASEKRFRSIFENAGVGIAKMDMNGIFTLVNESFCRMLGYTREELIGRGPSDITHPDDRGAASKVREQLLLSDAPNLRFEKRYLHKNGSTVWVRCALALLRDAEGTPFRIVGIVEDISDLKNIESSLRQKDARLREVHKLEAIGTLAGGIAHDFNNLLMIINSHAESLMESAESEQSAKRSYAILDAGNRAAQLTGQLLAFSRQQMVQPKVIALDDIVSDCKTMLRRLIREDVTLESEHGCSRSCIKADPIQIEQVLMNLVVNARDAMSSGGAITIKTSRLSIKRRLEGTLMSNIRPGDYLLVTVSDTGCGIPEDVRPRIFEPFFTTKEAGKGTGMGLAMVYGIVKQCRGFIFCDSKVGEGTTFTVYLPEVAETPNTLRPVASVPMKAMNASVLLVEDEEGLRELLHDGLTQHGFKVTSACDGAEALQKLGLMKSVDVVVTDAVMPNMSGKEVIESVRASHPDTRFILMSGYTDLPQSISNDASTRFMNKPFSPNDLVSAVSEMVGA